MPISDHPFHLKKYVLLLSFIATITVLHAQTFEGGLVAGFNLSQLDGDKLSGFNKIGLSAGGQVKASLSERWALGFQLLYGQQGSSRTRDDDPSSIYDKIRLNFVEAPVLIHFTDWKFEVDAGLVYSRLINYKVTDFTGIDISDNENYRPDVFSVLLGVTFWPGEKIGWNFRWLRALTDLRTDGGDNRMLGRTISLRLYYML